MALRRSSPSNSTARPRSRRRSMAPRHRRRPTATTQRTGSIRRHSRSRPRPSTTSTGDSLKLHCTSAVSRRRDPFIRYRSALPPLCLNLPRAYQLILGVGNCITAFVLSLVCCVAPIGTVGRRRSNTAATGRRRHSSRNSKVTIATGSSPRRPRRRLRISRLPGPTRCGRADCFGDVLVGGLSSGVRDFAWLFKPRSTI